MKNTESTTVQTALYSYWRLHPEAERGTCEMISSAGDRRLATLLSVPTIDIEFSHHAARCERCRGRLESIVDAHLPSQWHGKSIIDRLAEFKRRMNASDPGDLLKVQRI